MNIKTIIFDIGNVLIHFNHDFAIHQLADLCDVSKDVVQAELFTSGLEWSYEEGKISSEEFHREAQRRLNRQFSIDDFERGICAIFWANAPMLPLVTELKERGYRLILLSNTSPWHFGHCEANYPVIRLFDDRVLSYQVGACKPDGKIFEKAIHAAKCSAGECFYTDDIPEYVEKAKRLGINAELFVNEVGLRTKLRQLNLLP